MVSQPCNLATKRVHKLQSDANTDIHLAMISIISTFLSLFLFSGKKKTLNVPVHKSRCCAVFVLAKELNSIFYFYSQNRLFPNKKMCIAWELYMHKPFFPDSYCSNHCCSFGNSVMALFFNGTFSREWKKKRIWKKQTFLSLSWLWIVLMITIDPPPERVKIHAAVKKCLGWNALCNFHCAPIVRFSTSSPTVLKEYTIIFLRSLM